jgi:hypothetical protein
MLAESMNLFLFSHMVEVDPSEPVAAAPTSTPAVDSSKKVGNASLKAFPDKKQGKDADSGFLFWRRKSPGSPISAKAVADDVSDAPAFSYSDFLLSLLTCSPALSDSSAKSSGGDAPLSPLLGAAGIHHSFNGVSSSDNVQSMQSTGSNSKSSLAEAERIMWRFVTASNLEEFVTCRGTRRVSQQDLSRRDAKKVTIADGYAPTKAQAMDVLKQYRRALQALGWKLDRKKIAAMRERGTGPAGNNHPSQGAARAQGMHCCIEFKVDCT